MITGWCAISMYHQVTSFRKLMVWDIDPIANPIKREKAPERVAKYVSRGFEIVEYSPEATNTTAPQWPKMTMHPRSISDAGCLVIDFESVLNYRTPFENAMHNAAMEEILSMKWSEGKGPNSRLTWAKAQGESAECGVYRSMKMTEDPYTLEIREPDTPVKIMLVHGDDHHGTTPAFTDLILERDVDHVQVTLQDGAGGSVTNRFAFHSTLRDAKMIPVV